MIFKIKHKLHIVSGLAHTSGVPKEFCSGEVQKIRLRTEDRENGDLGAVAV